jgi:hypothetical protein
VVERKQAGMAIVSGALDLHLRDSTAQRVKVQPQEELCRLSGWRRGEILKALKERMSCYCTCCSSVGATSLEEGEGGGQLT